MNDHDTVMERLRYIEQVGEFVSDEVFDDLMNNCWQSPKVDLPYSEYSDDLRDCYRIMDWAKYHKFFKTDFILSLIDWLETDPWYDSGSDSYTSPSLSPKQRVAVDKILDRFDINKTLRLIISSIGTELP